MMTAHITPKVFEVALCDMIDMIKVKMIAGWRPGESFGTERVMMLGAIDSDNKDDIPEIVMHFRYQVGSEPEVRRKVFLRYVELKNKNPDKLIVSTILYAGTDKYSFNPEYASEEEMPETEYNHGIKSITFPVLDLGKYGIELVVKTGNPDLIGIIPALDREKRQKNPEQFLKEVTYAVRDFVLTYPEKRHDILEDIILVAMLIWQRNSEPIKKVFEEELFGFLSKRDRMMCEIMLGTHDKEVWELLADRAKKFWEIL